MGEGRVGERRVVDVTTARTTSVGTFGPVCRVFARTITHLKILGAEQTATANVAIFARDSACQPR